jgi:tRNA threonylcarbamoyladenosine biosynthesis protein TsaE
MLSMMRRGSRVEVMSAANRLHTKSGLQPIAVRQWLAHYPEETRALGLCLGRRAKRGDFIACCGTLGAGKTTFIQGFAQGLGVGSEAYVRSPTFTLIHEYSGQLPLYHFDFYRLVHSTEVQDIGFDEYCGTDGVVIVEWADKFPELLPSRRLDICIEILSAESRAIWGMAYDESCVYYLQLEAEKKVEL